MATHLKKGIKVAKPTKKESTGSLIPAVVEVQSHVSTEEHSELPLEGNHETFMIEQMIEEKDGDKPAVLKWVTVTDGVIPAYAVEGGWIESSKQPLYIARVKTHTGLIPGYVNKANSNFCYYFNGSYVNQSNTFEVLINPGNSAILDWVKCNGSSIPTNAFEAGYVSAGKCVYVARHVLNKKDIMIGYVDPSNGILNLQDVTKYQKHTCRDFHILVVHDDVEIIEEIDRCELHGVHYALDEGVVSKISVTLDEFVFQNHSSVEQKFKSQPSFEVEKTYCWDVGSKTELLTEIKGNIPVTNAEGDLKMDIIHEDKVEPLYPVNVGGQQVLPSFRNGIVYFANNYNMHLINQQMPVIPLQAAMVKVRLGDRLIQSKTQKEALECKVPPKSETKVKVRACKVVLQVPLTGHLKKVYKNGMTAEEDVRGTYTGTFISHIIPVIMKDEKIKTP